MRKRSGALALTVSRGTEKETVKNEGMNRTAKNVLVLGYVQANTPWLTTCGIDVRQWHTCQYLGICADIWRSLLPLFGYPKVQLKQSSSYGDRNERGRWNGLLGMLQRGEIDGTLSDIVMDEERFSDFVFTMPFNQLRFGFAMGQMVADESERPLRVQVFAQSVLILLCVVAILFGLHNSIQMRDVKSGFWRAVALVMMQDRSSNWRGIHTPYTHIGFTILIAIYYSGFKSQTITNTGVTEVKQVPMMNMIERLRTREYQLVIEDLSQLPLAVLQDIMQIDMNANVNASSIFDLVIESDKAKIAKLVCASDRAVYYGTIHQLFDANPDKRKCFLTEMRVENVLVSRLSQLSFAFRRGFNRTTLEAINEHILSVYTEGHADGFLGSRYDMNDRRKQTTQGDVQPIKLKQLCTGFLVWLSGIGLSLLCFSICKLRQELFASRISRRNRSMREALSRQIYPGRSVPTVVDDLTFTASGNDRFDADTLSPQSFDC